MGDYRMKTTEERLEHSRKLAAYLLEWAEAFNVTRVKVDADSERLLVTYMGRGDQDDEEIRVSLFPGEEADKD